MFDFIFEKISTSRVSLDTTKLLILSFIVALALRLYLLTTSLNSINSDEAIIGLMARHILKGEYPLFFYGQKYYGPLDAYLTAPLFAVFGSNRIILKVVPIVSSLLFVYVIYWLGKTLYSESIGLYSAMYAALPPAMLTVRQLQADAAYPLVLLIGTFSLLVFNGFRDKFSWIRFWLLVCFFGIGFWLHPIMGYYLAAMIFVFLFWFLRISLPKFTLRYRLVFIVSLFLVISIILYLLGGISFITRLRKYLIAIATVAIPVILGIFKPYDQYKRFTIERLASGPLLNGVSVTIALILVILILRAGLKNFKQKNILLYTFVIITALIYSEFVIFLQVNIYTLAYPRYISPIYSAIPLGMFGLFSYTKKSKLLRPLILVVLLGINLYGNLTFNYSKPSYLLRDWMVERGGTQYVYTDYWTGYWLAFESQEKVIPYIIDEQNEPGLNRYLPYKQEVPSALNPVYIFKMGQPGEQKFKQELIADQVYYQSIQMSGYALYFDLSKPISFVK